MIKGRFTDNDCWEANEWAEEAVAITMTEARRMQILQLADVWREAKPRAADVVMTIGRNTEDPLNDEDWDMIARYLNQLHSRCPYIFSAKWTSTL